MEKVGLGKIKLQLAEEPTDVPLKETEKSAIFRM